MKRHVLLVGLSGSGKSTAGALAARVLGAAFVDADAVIEQEAGMPVSEIFASRGEAAFRALETETVERTLRSEARVVASGGGWAAQAGSLDSAHARALIIYLRVSPEVAGLRLTGADDRPLLPGRGPERASRLNELLRQRERYYLVADVVVDTDRLTPEEVAAEIVRLARSDGGW
jgi:shikimate kinase